MSRRTLHYPFNYLVSVVCVAATIVYCLREAPSITSRPAWKNALGFFEFSGIVVFSMEGVGVTLPIENNMKDPKQFPKVLCMGKYTGKNV